MRPSQSTWRTTDGSAWWLRDTVIPSELNYLTGNYKPYCYLNVFKVGPDEVRMNDNNCEYHATEYLCQPAQRTWMHA